MRDVGLVVEDGSCVVVCGSSGCGKTTVCRLANGLAPSFFPGQMQGRVLVDNDDIAEMASWQVSLRVGSVFQNPRTQFFNRDSTSEVAFGLESQGLPEDEVRARTDATIAELGLDGLAHRSIFDLSGGQKQRIAYASVWATRPGNFVFDEPTSNLDLAAIADLRRYLKAAKAAGMAVLVAEHRLWWLDGVADHVAFMRSGHIERLMTMAEFKDLGDAKCAALGLRPLDLGSVRPRAPRPDEGPAPARGATLDISGLCAGYKDHPVLKGVSLSCRAGEVLAVVGSNGAGKSTLCRTIAGLLKEDAGEVRLGGRRLTAKQRLHHCSLVFQDVNYQIFAASVREEVGFGLKGGRAPSAARVDELLGSLNLAPYADVHPATLSGGQKQRLAVASCLASGAAVLMFDEPTSGLDLASMQRVASLIRGLAAREHIVLVITHDLEFVAAACDRAVELAEGRIRRCASVSTQMDAVRSMLGATQRQEVLL